MPLLGNRRRNCWSVVGMSCCDADRFRDRYFTLIWPSRRCSTTIENGVTHHPCRRGEPDQSIGGAGSLRQGRST